MSAQQENHALAGHSCRGIALARTPKQRQQRGEYVSAQELLSKQVLLSIQVLLSKQVLLSS